MQIRCNSLYAQLCRQKSLVQPETIRNPEDKQDCSFHQEMHKISQLRYRCVANKACMEKVESSGRNGTNFRVTLRFVPFHFVPGHFVPVISSPGHFVPGHFVPWSFRPLLSHHPIQFHMCKIIQFHMCTIILKMWYVVTSRIYHNLRYLISLY
jgi:hypothetical protein